MPGSPRLGVSDPDESSGRLLWRPALGQARGSGCMPRPGSPLFDLGLARLVSGISPIVFKCACTAAAHDLV